MVVTDDFRRAHGSLGVQTEALRQAARGLTLASPEERGEVRDLVVAFLRSDVEPHTRLDERLLYPAVNDRLGAPLATASMAYDHVAIRRYVADIAAADVADVDRLQELLYGLDA